ncbi:unnamed protein product [Adineta ricciae]|uniref:Uncharacterized protein n=1 Tax=Adineta ricciae TaxID=249248 RepID=A0A813ZKC7_ADIRI|nr:unnamed protein product [Adineta ricciae]CAF1532850.1 unnamed protein product [Adineta ricciae]
MSVLIFHLRKFRHNKRAAIRWNIGGHEQNTVISGANNSLRTTNPVDSNDETLLRKFGSQLGRMLQGGTDIVISPAKWLSHMQDNWYVFSRSLYRNRLIKTSRCGT